MTYQALILRDAARAAATVREFEQLGIESCCARLIDTVWPADRSELSRGVAALAAGSYQWLVLTSVNTVEVIATLLAGRPLPPRLRVAAVGTKTAKAARARLGVDADFVPTEQSAAGMVAQWRLEPGQKIFYPHGDLASSTLSAGLGAHEVHEVLAYRTVAAGSGGAPLTAVPAPPGIRVLAPEEITRQLDRLDLLVFSAPSIVRRFVQLAGDRLPERVKTVAIGQPTAAALRAAGLRADAIAAEPTPAGLARAAQELLHNANHQF
ncbi:uroporphyrinogen-III synthase [Glutamicibacter sp. AOP38-B1-38]|uniref:uroporphyrinogen-III synthase n=1 Tax=unclassified Glutamicibacter TaxID=2627139 RepID=UPI004033D32F